MNRQDAAPRSEKKTRAIYYNVDFILKDSVTVSQTLKTPPLLKSKLLYIILHTKLGKKQQIIVMCIHIYATDAAS